MPPPAAVGRIVLKNTYAMPVRIILNDRSYPLEPGETWVLDNQPAGAFSYEVLGGPSGVVQARVNRFLEAGREYPITVFTRQP